MRWLLVLCDFFASTTEKCIGFGCVSSEKCMRLHSFEVVRIAGFVNTLWSNISHFMDLIIHSMHSFRRSSSRSSFVWIVCDSDGKEFSSCSTETLQRILSIFRRSQSVSRQNCVLIISAATVSETVSNTQNKIDEASRIKINGRFLLSLPIIPSSRLDTPGTSASDGRPPHSRAASPRKPRETKARRPKSDNASPTALAASSAQSRAASANSRGRRAQQVSASRAPCSSQDASGSAALEVLRDCSGM